MTRSRQHWLIGRAVLILHDSSPLRARLMERRAHHQEVVRVGDQDLLIEAVHPHALDSCKTSGGRSEPGLSRADGWAVGSRRNDIFDVPGRHSTKRQTLI
jgi:hypothetical protein